MDTQRMAAAALVVLVACWSPSDPATYVTEHGGLESQYEEISTSDDCTWLREMAVEMDDRYDRERDGVLLVYHRAAVDRMSAIDCD